MTELPHIFGRERELAQLSMAIGPGDDGFRVVRITGPSGLGKSTLLAHALERAASSGFRIATSNARTGVYSAPFAPWSIALPDFRPGAKPDVDQLGVELVALLAGICVETPLILALDDAQALDESSIALLPYVANISESMNLTLLLVEQTDAPGVLHSFRTTIEDITSNHIVQVIDLSPLDDETICTIVRSAMLLEDEADLPIEVVVRAQGNPWFAKELAQVATNAGDEIPTNIAAAATTRLSQLSEAAQDIVCAISLCPDGAMMPWMRELVGGDDLKWDSTISEVRSSGIFREDGDILDIAHPLMRDALRAELSAAMCRALHQELAGIIADQPMLDVASHRAQGFHLQNAGKTDDAVLHYMRAADANEKAGQIHEAAADYVRALDAEARIEKRVDILRKCGYAATQIGDDRALEYWSELARLAASLGDLNTQAFALFQYAWANPEGVDRDRLERAANLGPDKYGWSARSSASLAFLNNQPAQVIEFDSDALKLEEKNADPLLRTISLHMLGLATLLGLDNSKQAIGRLQQALETAIENNLHEWAITTWTTLSEALELNLETRECIVRCEQALSYVETYNLQKYRPMVESFLAYAYMLQGRLSEAVSHAQNASLLNSQMPHRNYEATVELSNAYVMLEVGSIQHAGATVSTLVMSIETAESSSSYETEARFAQARYLELTGEIDKAIDIARKIDMDEPAFMTKVARWLKHVSLRRENTMAGELANQIRTQITSTSPMCTLLLDEIDSIERAVENRAAIDDLMAIASRWSDAERPLDNARVVSAAALIATRHGDKKYGLELMTAARSIFSSLGATADADFSTAAMRQMGARSRVSSRATLVGNLTNREVQIARLVAAGLRNSDVANRTFLAEKTVAAHLSNIYAKLEISSRVQLSAWIEENDVSSEVV